MRGKNDDVTTTSVKRAERRPGACISALAAAWLLVWAGAQSAAIENPVTATVRQPVLVADQIDRHIEAPLIAAKVALSPQVGDAEFLRRATLDITGRIPTAERTLVFLNDNRPDRRAMLIDELLADRAYGEHFATIWYYRMIKPDTDNKRLILGNTLHDWLASRFNQNQPWDRLVADLVTASGERDENPATTFLLAQVVAGQPDASKLTAAVSRLFLGVRLECCECHNHPFTKLQQSDFWGMAAFFTATRGIDRNNKVPRINDVSTQDSPSQRNKNGAALVGSIVIPDSNGQTVKAKFLGGEQLVNPLPDRLRTELAAWLTAPSNPWFARAAANRLWANFFGRGIVNPIDDMRSESDSSHPEVLQLLAAEFTEFGFDQKHLIRCICLSKTYQRSSRVLPENKVDDLLYGRMPLKMMTADVLFNSLGVALDHSVAEQQIGLRKKIRKDAETPRDQFRKFFHAEADDDVGVVEDYTHGVPQALRLMNSAPMNDTAAVVAQLMKTSSESEQVIESLYLRVLSRKPTSAEARRMTAYVADEQDKSKAYADLMWVLLNSGEFVFNH